MDEIEFASVFDIGRHGPYEVKIGEFTIDATRKDKTLLTFRGREVVAEEILEPLQITILGILARNAHTIVPKHKLLQVLFGNRGFLPEHKIVDVVMCKMRGTLRKKLSPEAAKMFKTSWGIGPYLSEKEIRLSERPRLTEKDRKRFRGFTTFREFEKR